MTGHWGAITNTRAMSGIEAIQWLQVVNTRDVTFCEPAPKRGCSHVVLYKI